MKPEIVTTQVAKLPKATNKVDRIFQLAMKAARKEGWNHIIILGRNKKGKGQYFTSAMSDETAAGMMEVAKIDMLTGGAHALER